MVKLITIAILLCAICKPALSEYRKPFKPLLSAKLDCAGKVIFRWSFTKQIIKFEVSVPTLGWIGIGFSPSGTMKGADIIYAWMKNGEPQILDMYATINGLPQLDMRRNFRAAYLKQNGTHTTLFISRFLDTCDNAHDFAITDDTTRVIYAYGNEAPKVDRPTAQNYHGSNRGVKSLRLLDRRLPSVVYKGKKSIKSFEIRMRPFTIPKRETYYNCIYIKLPDFDKKHHMIQFEAILAPGNEKYIHHIILYHCNESLVTNKMLNVNEECYTNDGADHWRTCSPVVTSWAVGMTEFTLPRHVGFPLGVAGAPKIVELEIHYDNKALEEGIVDTSGIRVHYTDKLRQHDAGILLTGHDVLPTLFVPPGSKEFITQGHCSSQCLGEILSLGNVSRVHVFGAFLHSHTAGHRMILRHYRNGTELEPVAKDLAYDFDYQETKLLRQEKTIVSGDNLIMECVYDTTSRKVPTMGGLGTRDEMCFGFVMYYPKMKDAYCQSSPLSSVLLETLKAKDMSEAYNIAMIKNWTYEERRTFNEVQLKASLWELCLTLDGPIKGVKNPSNVPAVRSKFVEAHRRCNRKRSKRSDKKQHAIEKRSRITAKGPERQLQKLEIKSEADETLSFALVTAISAFVVFAVVGVIYYRYR